MPEHRTDTTAMAFTAVDLVRTIDNAAGFAGEDGRIATLPDIIDARISSARDAIAWGADITTSSVEYVGRTPGGTLVGVVAHGIGPLADVEFLAAAATEARNDARPFRVPDDQFRLLLGGAFGDVEVYDLREAAHRRKFHLQQPMSKEEACADTMVRARVGPRTEEFLDAHYLRSRKWLEDRGDYSTAHKCVIETRDPKRFSYLTVPDDIDGAYAFPLRITGADGYHHCHFGTSGPQDHTCLVSDLECHGWTGTTTLVGVRGDGPVKAIHPGLDAVRAGFRKHWPRLLKVNRRAATRLSTRALVEIDGLWFTQRPRLGVGVDYDHPEFAVKRRTKVGRTMTVLLPYRERVDRPLYDQDEVLVHLPPWCNAYRIVGGPSPRWLDGDRPHRPSHVAVKIDPYHVEIETRWFIPPISEIRRDYDRLLKFPADLS